VPREQQARQGPRVQPVALGRQAPRVMRHVSSPARGSAVSEVS
jgi:hypothetical protein